MEIIGLLLTIIFGYSLVWIIKPEISSYGKIALSYLIGLGVQTLIMFYLTLLRVRLTSFNVSLTITVLTLFIFLIGRLLLRDKSSFNPFANTAFPDFRKLKLVEKCLFILSLAIFIYVIIAGFYWPVVGWDSIALYDFRAKVFALTGYMDDAIARGYFFGYPLMTSMAHAWVYLLGGMYPKFLYSFMYISFSVLFFEILHKWTSRLTALVFSFLLLISPPIFSHSAFDYTNLPYTIYFFLGSIYLALWVKEKKSSLLILSALLLGLSTWIRSTDPFWVVNFIVLIIILIKEHKSLLYLFIYSAIFFAIQQSWSLFLSANAPHVSTVALATDSLSVIFKGLDIGRLFQIIVFVIEEILPILLPYTLLMILTILINVKNISKELYINLIVFGNFGLLFAGAYIFSYIYPGWDLIGESLGRMSFVLIPLFLFLSGINLRLEEIYQKHK